MDESDGFNRLAEATNTRAHDPVVVLGASTALGSQVARCLAEHFKVIGVSRTRKPSGGAFAWREADLLAYDEARAAITGARVVVDLISHVASSARLTQGTREAIDLLAADNMARVARASGVERLVVVERKDRAPHAARALAVSGVPLAIVRAGAPEHTVSLVVAAAEGRVGAGRHEASGVDDAIAHASRRRDTRGSRSEGRSEGRSSFFVRSVQSMPMPPGRDAAWAAADYFEWLPRLMRGLVATSGDISNRIRIETGAFGATMLDLVRADVSDPDRVVLRVAGGQLAAPGEAGALEFRRTLGGSLITVLDGYRPRLPWSLYRVTQAAMHAWVHGRFARRLRREAELPRLDVPR